MSRHGKLADGYEGRATEADAALVLAMTPDMVKLGWEAFLRKVAP